MIRPTILSAYPPYWATKAATVQCSYTPIIALPLAFPQQKKKIGGTEGGAKFFSKKVDERATNAR
jgi:hypothetical protein